MVALLGYVQKLALATHIELILEYVSPIASSTNSQNVVQVSSFCSCLLSYYFLFDFRFFDYEWMRYTPFLHSIT
jgi:hypothetical protein